MRPLLPALASSVALAAALVRCTAFDAAQDTANAGDDAAVDAASAADAEAGGDAASSRCDSGCPGTAGSCGVKAGTTCIDAYEVTVADYRAFADSAAGASLDAGAPCGPVIVQPLGARPDEALPMTNVNFCEARAFCQWAGKSLCGRVGGGAMGPTETLTQGSAWFNACTGGTADSLHMLSDGGCQLEAGAPRVAGSGCQGGVPGLFDMIGNVFEWIDQPNLVDGGTPTAVITGGSYVTPVGRTCKDPVVAAKIDFRGNDVGFRCCSP